MTDQELPARYVELRERVLNALASEADIREFEELTFQSRNAREDFVQHLHQESVLILQGGGVPMLRPSTIEVEAPRRWFSRRRVLASFAAVAASLVLLAAAYSFHPWRSHGVFSIANARNCQWAFSTVPISEGQVLGPGRLVLNSGIAVLRLPHVDLSIEGVCDIEIIDARHCRLHQGKAFAEVKPGGEGFVIETPTSVLTDRGTVFAVNVSDTGQSDLRVVAGLVDVEHRASGESVSVKTNGRLRSTVANLETLDQTEDAGPIDNNQDTKQTPDVTIRQLQISTAVGGGKDCYVIRRKERPETVTAGMLLVKTTDDYELHAPWRRRAYLHFDLGFLTDLQLTHASLHLEGVSSGVGFLSRTPDTTFAIYGLTDESREDWDENSLTWETCPGIQQNHETIDPNTTVLLGRFTVSSARITNRFKIEGDALTRFLAADKTGGATLIIVSETNGPGESWVHGFASRRHPELTPPTLRLDVMPLPLENPTPQAGRKTPKLGAISSR